MPDDRLARDLVIYDQFESEPGRTITVQSSTARDEPTVWLSGTGWRQGTRVPFSAHLSFDEARRVRDALTTFISENTDATL